MAGRVASVAATKGKVTSRTRGVKANRGQAAKPTVAPQAIMPRPKLLLSQEEAAAELGIGLTFFEELRDNEQIHVLNVGRLRRVAYAELVRYVRTRYEQDGAPLDDMMLAG